MHADAALSAAWGHIPSPGSAESMQENFAGRRMERILAIVGAIGSGILGAQAMVFAINASSGGATGPQIALLVVVYVPLVAMLIACVIARGVPIVAGAFAVTYVAALAAWPVVVAPLAPSPGQPWIFFLVDVSVFAAILAFPIWAQLMWAVLVPLAYGLVRLIETGFGSVSWTHMAFDVSFMVILGLVLVALAWMFRSVAAGVDDARGRAVASYADAAGAAAAEEERIAMAALMHDSVLAALLAAERADSERSRDLAVAMAREALTRLANTEAAVAQEGRDDPVETGLIIAELRRALSELGADAIVEERGVAGLVPGRAARAIVLAARQAIGNALAHASGRGLHVIVESVGETGINVTIVDAGPGFDLADIAEDRLGIRASILARMAAVAGHARIDSGPDGTRIDLVWEQS